MVLYEQEEKQSRKYGEEASPMWVSVTQWSNILTCILPNNFANVTFLVGILVGVLLFFLSRRAVGRKWFWLVPLLITVTCEIAAQIGDYLESFIGILPIMIGSITLGSALSTLICIGLARFLQKVLKR